MTRQSQVSNVDVSRSSLSKERLIYGDFNAHKYPRAFNKSYLIVIDKVMSKTNTHLFDAFAVSNSLYNINWSKKFERQGLTFTRRKVHNLSKNSFYLDILSDWFDNALRVVVSFVGVLNNVLSYL